MVLMKNEVSLSEKSLEIIKNTFKMYEEVQEPICEIDGRCVIHLYPARDTIDDSDDVLLGFKDSLLFEAHVYDVRAGRVYKYKFSDSVTSDVPMQVKIFKDLSTMVVITGKFNLMYGSSLMIYNG